MKNKILFILIYDELKFIKSCRVCDPVMHIVHTSSVSVVSIITSLMYHHEGHRRFRPRAEGEKGV